MDMHGCTKRSTDRYGQVRATLLVECSIRLPEANAAFDPTGINDLCVVAAVAKDVISPLFVEQTASDRLSLD